MDTPTYRAAGHAATGGGTLFDRQVFSALNLASGDSLQTTYDLTIG